MTVIHRGTARREGVIEGDIDNLWALLTDWGNMAWWGNDLEQERMKASRTYLEGEKGKVPRAKVIERAHADGPSVVEPGDLVFVRDTVEAVYELIFKGLNNYLAQRGGKYVATD